VSQIETSLQKRIVDILEPVVGPNNLRATVNAEVDFSQLESTSEEFKPNQGDPSQAAVRSQQTTEQGSAGSATPAGVPGATSNQPPVAATAPLTGASAPLQGAPGSAISGNMRRDKVTNYEVDKTVRVVRGATGTVKRINAAVVVNQHVTKDAEGKVKSTPLSQEELDKLTALVQESIGYDKARGDSVRVINVPFRTEDDGKAESLPIWQQAWVSDLLHTIAVPGAMALVALMVVMGLIRPALRAIRPVEVKGTKLDAVVADNEPLPALPALTAPRVTSQLEGARSLAKENPAAVANIVRGWVSGDVA
jgi:flagellar M-ring protein FliF